MTIFRTKTSASMREKPQLMRERERGGKFVMKTLLNL